MSSPVINTDIAFDTPAIVATAASATTTIVSDPITRAEVEAIIADLKEVLSRYGIA